MEKDDLDTLGSDIMEALERLKQYEAIGTTEECKKAMDRMTPRKPVDKTMVLDRKDYVGDIGKCPVCGSIVTEDDACCSNCYQVLSWKIEDDDQELPEDGFKEIPAETLPEGWTWRIYNNGTGYLMDPDEDRHYIYGITLNKKNRIKYQEFDGADPEFFDEDDIAFRRFAESDLFATSMSPEEDDSDLYMQPEPPWESQYTLVQAKNLPEGWQWQMYNDGSGCLISPGKEESFFYDRGPYCMQGWTEYREEAKSSYNTFHDSFEAFQAYAETVVLDKLSSN